MKTLKVLAIVFGITFLYSSCAKDGATGPAGPSGTNGTNGAAGATGPTGPSIVVVTDSFYLASASWLLYASNSYSNSYSNANITSPIVNKGSVEAFVFDAISGQWFSLDDVVAGGSGYRYAYKAGTITLYADNFVSSPKNESFKAVLIPGSVIRKHPNTNWKDYGQVMAILDAQNIFNK
ncbi:MAG TPA: collagen-like protein [Bacteroidia bacterium]|jgi:hypothetical protein|nr:collagen-like protein [Bacteroidia bacterium]